jgi:hypothetical protein
MTRKPVRSGEKLDVRTDYRTYVAEKAVAGLSRKRAGDAFDDK